MIYVVVVADAADAADAPPVVAVVAALLCYAVVVQYIIIPVHSGYKCTVCTGICWETKSGRLRFP